jgi:hypothetical protein
MGQVLQGADWALVNPVTLYRYLQALHRQN